MSSTLFNGRSIALLMAASLTILSNTIISPALTELQVEFANEPNVMLLVPLLVTVPSIMVAIIAPFAGLVADRVGRKRQLITGVLLFAISGSAGLWLDSLIAILVSRLLLGVSVALIMTAQTLLIGDYFIGEARSRFMGLQIAATNLGGLIFILVAGQLASISPFLPFGIYLVGLCYLPLMWLKLTDTKSNMMSNTVSEGVAHNKAWPITLALVILISMSSLIGFYLIPTQAPFFLAAIGHTKPSSSAILLASLTLAGGLCSLSYSKVRSRFGRAITSAIGYVFYALGFLVLSMASTFSTSLIGVLLIGGATGLLFPIFLTIGLEIAPSRWRGLASGALTTAIFLGQFFSPIIAHPLIEAVGFSSTFKVAAGMFVILGLIAPFVFREKSTVAASS